MLPHRSGLLLSCLVLCGAPAAEAATPRIVALTPFAANTLADIGVRPVAVGAAPRLSARLDGVPRLTLSHPTGPNLELLAARRPTLVFSAAVWRRGHEAMRRLGMRVVLPEPRSVAAAVAVTRRIGRLAGRARTADRQARALETAIAAARRRIRRHPRVLVVLGVGRTTYGFLRSTWGGDVVTQAGGRLITAGLRAGTGYARISDEFVVAQDPDVIIAVPHGAPKDLASVARGLRSRPGWRRTRAAREGHVFVATGDHLLQPSTDVAATIWHVRRAYLGT